MTIYRVYESKWGDVSEVKIYLNEDAALRDFKARNSIYTHMDEEEVITE